MRNIFYDCCPNRQALYDSIILRNCRFSRIFNDEHSIGKLRLAVINQTLNTNLHNKNTLGLFPQLRLDSSRSCMHALLFCVSSFQVDFAVVGVKQPVA